MGQHIRESLEISCLDVLRRASIHGDIQAWTAFQLYLEDTVLGWFHEHPGNQAVCRVQSDTHFVARAFEWFWQAVVQGLVDCETLSEVLMYLLACLNGVILETLRVSRRPGTVLHPWSDAEDHPDRNAVWDKLQALLSNECERRLAYLLYHCGLKPAEIVSNSPQEWSDVHEIACLRRIIFVRLMNGLNCEGQTFV
jgi:hypothetical protein